MTIYSKLSNGAVPIDKTASNVLRPSPVGDRFEGKKNIGKAAKLFWDFPKPHVTLNYNDENLTGIKFGRFTVTGKLANGKWQVRCACSNYAERKAKAIKNPKNTCDCCEVCRELLFLRRNEAHRKGDDKATWETLS